MSFNNINKLAKSRCGNDPKSLTFWKQNKTTKHNPGDRASVGPGLSVEEGREGREVSEYL